MAPEYLPLLTFGGTLLALAGVYRLVTYIQHRQGVSAMSLSEFVKILEKVAPLILSVVPGVPPILVPAIVHGIQVAEALPGLSGKDKKASVIDLVATAISTTNSVAGKQVVDPSVINAVSNGIDTVVGVVNVVKKQPVAPDADLLTP